MQKSLIMKSLSKKLLSLLLILAVMLSLAVPFEITASAEGEEESSSGEEYYAMLYDIRKTPKWSGHWGGYELVIQRGDDVDEEFTETNESAGVYRKVFVTKFPYSQFGTTDHGNLPVWATKTPADVLTSDETGNSTSGKNELLRKLIKRVVIRDKIQPESISGWFYSASSLEEIVGLRNLDTSNCTDISYAFGGFKIKKLDLSFLNTSKVTSASTFINSTALEELDVHGLDLSGITGDLSYFIKAGYEDKGVITTGNLKKVNVTGINLSKAYSVQYFLTYTKYLEEIDLTGINLEQVSRLDNFIRTNLGLKTVKFGQLKLGAKAGDNPNYEKKNEYNTLYLSYFFKECSALEEVDFGNWEIDLQSPLTSIQYAEMFRYCKNLTTIKNIDHLFTDYNSGSSSWYYRYMFEGCESLEEIDLSWIGGSLGGFSIFKNCYSLRTLDLSNLGMTGKAKAGWGDWHYWNYRSFFNRGAGTTADLKDISKMETNIYEGCEELTDVSFSPYYPPKTQQRKTDYYVIGASGSIPPNDREWIKIEQYDVDKYNSTSVCWRPSSGDDQWKALSTCPVGTKLSTAQLFGDFQPQYAGRWVAISQINLRGNGGTPANQQIPGAKDVEVDYDETENKVVTPTRNGYTFTGWYSEKANGSGELLSNKTNTKAKSWSYYAHWTENTYDLVLYGNEDGTTVIDGETVDHFTAAENLKYSEYFDLNNSMFTREGYVLSGWNTRPNGLGVEYAPNDSVNKLAEVNGATARLYAQWSKPDVIIKFDANYTPADGETLPVIPDKNYTIATGTTVKYGAMTELSRNEYSFLGWYTTPDSDPEKEDPITADSEVGSSRTLYAQWAANPIITFNANGGHFETQSGTSNTIEKHYNYDQNLGVIPTPVHPSAVLKGWYTAADDSGVKIDNLSAVKAKSNTEYFAHWGYRPEFNSNGGVYNSYPDYETLDTASYVIAKTATINGPPTLPTFKNTPGKNVSDFLGWYFNDQNLNDLLDASETGTITLDLSTNKTIVAHWTTKDIYTVTLSLDGGTLSNNYYNADKTGYEIKVYAGNSVESLPTPTKTAAGVPYDFLGWYTEADGGDQKDYRFIPTGNCTLYAHWVAKSYTVTFNPNGGKMYLPDQGSTNATMKVSSTVPALPLVTREGYYLVGWYPNAEGTGDELTTSTTITENTTYYAKWAAATAVAPDSAEGLYKYLVMWRMTENPYATATGDTVVVAPTNGSNDISVRLFIKFDFVKDSELAQAGGKLPANSVKIKIPKTVFKDKNGNGVGSVNIDSGFSTTPVSNSNYVYYVDPAEPDYYIITNYFEIDKDSSYEDQEFELDYKITASELKTVKGGYYDENGYFAGDYYSREVDAADTLEGGAANPKAPLKVIIQVDRDKNGTPETDITKKLGIEVHTMGSATPTKTRADASFSWREEWNDEGQGAPADADQYFYIVWTLSASFNSSTSQSYKFSWSESPVHDGTIVKVIDPEGYSPTKEYSGATSYNTTVITKHPRTLGDAGWQSVHNEAVLNVDWSSGYSQQFRVFRNAGVYLHEDVDTPYVFEKYIKDLSSSRVINGGPEQILSHSSVDLPFEIRYQEYENLDLNNDPTSVIWHDGSRTYEAPERTISICDGAKGRGDVVISTVDGLEPYSWDAPDAENKKDVVLSDADYSFTQLTIYLTEYDAVKGSVNWSEPFVHTTIGDYGDVEIWTRGVNENSFTFFRRLTASDFTAPDAERGEKPSNGAAIANVTLPDDTSGYKVIHKSSFFTTKLYVQPNLKLKSSNRVYSQVKEDVLNNKNTLVKNGCTLSINNGAEQSSRRMDTNGGYDSSYELKMGESYIYAYKKCASDQKYFTKDTETQEFPVVIVGWTLNSTGTMKLVESGVFYDLLPYNFTVDKNSVFVKIHQSLQSTDSTGPGSYDDQLGKNNFPKSLYSVEFFEDWQGSGHTMMKITITGVPEAVKNSTNGFKVFYKMKTTYANVVAYSTTETNYVSFTDTTEDQTVPVAKYGDISSLGKKVMPYYKDIDDEFTAYASATTSCDSPVSHATGFSSSVKTEGEFMYSDKTVGLGSEYTYNVIYQNGSKTANNLIAYDVIENSLTGENYEWHGTFQSVDISSLAEMKTNGSTTVTCNPIVYYCTKSGALTQSDLDIVTNPGGIWSDIEPANKADIKAICIDCRKASDNSKFELPANKALSFNITMKSPDSFAKNDVLTYNQAQVKGIRDSVQIDSTTTTSVLLHYVNPVITISSFPDSGTDENRTGVVNDSTIEYSITITNPDQIVPIRNVIVEDLLDAKLKINSSPKVQRGSDEPILIKNAAGVSYTVEHQETSGRDKFIGTISSLEPGETITLIVPATVTGAANGYDIDNFATITSANGNPAAILSETTYHDVTNTQAKIKKVDANKNGLAGASLQILNSAGSEVLVDNITSTTDVMTFDLLPGTYILHEVSTPDNSLYKPAADITFTIDVEGINKVNGSPVNYVEMVDEPAYKIVFHTNEPGHDQVFRTFGPSNLDSENKLAHFYAIPDFGGDEYVFAGWYHASGYAATDSPDDDATIAVKFGDDADTYPRTAEENPADYHIYARWIQVGKVTKAEGDTNNYGGTSIRGFGLAGVQIRLPGFADLNHGDAAVTRPGGMRFVASVSESLLTGIKGLNNQNPEYGFVVATESNINEAMKQYNVKDPSKYKLQYKGTNVNGVDTTGETTKTADTNFSYVVNVNCTSQVGGYGGDGAVARDHQNFANNYRLYTLVVTYEDDDASFKNAKLDARAYIRYTDANGMVRVFYNDYKSNMYHGGCMCSFNQVSSMALPVVSDKEEE